MGDTVVNRVIDFSVRNKFLVFAVVAVACWAGWWSMRHIALDAIPELGDTQVIVYSRWDRSPDLVEDQVTYPIVSALLGAPRVKAAASRKHTLAVLLEPILAVYSFRFVPNPNGPPKLRWQARFSVMGFKKIT